MDLQLQSNLEHQAVPVERIASVFDGVRMLPPQSLYANPVVYGYDGHLEGNLRRIVRSPGLAPFNREVALPESGPLHLDIKMETGTGKTYVYTHAIYELHRRYGFFKFVVVVHSLPVKSGATLFMADPYVLRHFRDTLGYRAEIDLCEAAAQPPKGKRSRTTFPSAVRDFALGSRQTPDHIYVLVANQQLLQAGKLLDRNDYDTIVNGFSRPLDAIKATRPIVIIDEPHRFGRDNKTYRRIESELEPQCIIRFGATFPDVTEGRGSNKTTRKDYLNLLYNLTAADAFGQNLIKGVAKEHFAPASSENEKIRVAAINGRESVTMQHTIGSQAPTTHVLRVGDSLATVSPAMGGITVTGIKKGEVELSNGQAKHQGDAFAADVYTTSYQENMVKLALYRHFETERKLFHRESKIKALALFFIDSITSFRGDKDGQGAWLRDTFDRLLDERLRMELKKNNSAEYASYLMASLADLAACRAGYFARDNSDTDEAVAAEVDDILRNKKRLLSLRNGDGSWNTRRFLFSKWTLKEGWDNPNVFTIAKLRSSGSETSKLQEVGRGLRLPVDEGGNRISDSSFMLNYIVDFSEKDFADKLVREINGDMALGATHINIKLRELAALAEARGTDANALAVKLITDGLAGINGDSLSINDDRVMDFLELFPEFSANSAAASRVTDNNKKGSRLMVKVRPENFDKLRQMWEEMNRKYLMFYTKGIDRDMEDALPGILADGVFAEATVSSERKELQTSGGIATLASAANATLKAEGRAMPYNEFLKRANIATAIPISSLHKAICRYAESHAPLGAQAFNSTSLANIAARFADWKTRNLGGRIRYKQTDYSTKSTALTNADGSMRDEVAMGRIGRMTDNSPMPPTYLYDTIAFDSDIERRNILEGVDVAEVVVYGKIPSKSICIPTVTGEKYSPDFMYVVKAGDGRLTLNVVIEAKDKTQATDLTEKESTKISNARLFFEQLSADHPECPIRFERQINRQKVSEIIEKIANGT